MTARSRVPTLPSGQDFPCSAYASLKHQSCVNLVGLTVLSLSLRFRVYRFGFLGVRTLDLPASGFPGLGIFWCLNAVGVESCIRSRV